ncbi:hypothetical protein ET475_09200 [Microbacterium protaetiae]|uniref:Rieske domain-containing protein n=1 Tax=Microbacterium protaetiae TaxID=2509458 RepID=A0A4P6EG61_9MICO|nr:hypothetical protein [Microbacterium protaetiae]QAY60149.1 hypothetical protein ET475_09200 [Microbacterium protaetiae]
MRHRVSVIVAALALAVGLAGCSGPGVTAQQIKGLPTEIPGASLGPDSAGMPLAVARGSDHLVVVVWDSLSCRPEPRSIATEGAVPVITFTSRGSTCTADLAATSYVIPAEEFGGSIPTQLAVVVDGDRADVTVSR